MSATRNWCGYACACGCGQRCACGQLNSAGRPTREHGLKFAPYHPAPANALGQIPVTCRTPGCVFAMGHDRRATKFTDEVGGHRPTPHSFEVPR